MTKSEHPSFTPPCELSETRHEQIGRDIDVGNAGRIVATEVNDTVGSQHLIVDKKITCHDLRIGVSIR